MDKIEKIRKFVKELQQDFISIQPKDCSLGLIKSYAGYAYLDKVLSFLDTLSEDGFAKEGISWGGDGTRGHSSTKSIHVTYKDIQDLESIDPKHLVHEKMEEPDKSLVEEMEKFIETFGWGKTKHLAEKELISATARHFAEWGAEHLKK